VTRKIEPQPGPQEAFLSTSADVALYGGSAGGGKTWALLMEPARHITNPDFGAMIFRRTSPQITMEGGMWDDSNELYPYLGARPIVTRLWWQFPSGAKVSFRHMEHENDKLIYDGAQIALLMFDQLEQFSASQFWYMFSRNRSTSGVKPYIRATVNPKPESWVADLLAWWIDQETGYAIEERSGAVRWFARAGEQIVWADSKAEVLERYPESPPKSFTFIRASVWDNEILLRIDPGYLANLMALPYAERERLVYGNWKVKASAGNVFRREWFKIVGAAPADVRWVRAYDLAASEKETQKDDPDYTARGKVGWKAGIYYLDDIGRHRMRWHGVKNLIVQTATLDGKSIPIALEQEPGASGKALIAEIQSMEKLIGHTVRGYPSVKDKVERANPWAAQAEAGNVKLVNSGWDIRGFLDECEMFPDGPHDDRVDMVSKGVQALGKGISMLDYLRGKYEQRGEEMPGELAGETEAEAEDKAACWFCGEEYDAGLEKCPRCGMEKRQ